MKSNKIHLLNLFISAVFVFQAPAFAEVVYDSLSTSQTSGIMIREIGNTVTLSGNKRFVTSFTINVGVGSSDIGQANDYILRFYLPTAPGNYPGRLFWQSTPKTNVVMTGEVQSITFEVPYIRVPNTFIYSVMQAGDGYFPMCDGSIIGSSPDYCWTNLTKEVFSGSNHLQVRIETQERTDARLLGWINHSSISGTGAEDHYSMRFEMKLGGYWDLFGPSFYGVTEWDKGSFLQLKATDVPEAANYLTNGVDESLRVLAASSLKGNVESDTIVKSPGIADGYPDLYGYIVTDFVLKIDNIIIDHSTPGWTYFTWNVTWEIWGIEKSDLSRDGKVNFLDFSIFASAWNSQAGQPHWNPFCDIYLPNDNKINFDDLQQFCSDWLHGCSTGLEENFETGDFSLYNWQHSGNAFWNIVSDTVYEGTYAAKSGVITHNGQSTLQVETNVEVGNISFFRKVSSESGYDYLRFYIDGVEQNKWSGNLGWSQVSFPVTPGLHTFKWSYTKDSSVSIGSDCAWLDQIKVE